MIHTRWQSMCQRGHSFAFNDIVLRSKWEFGDILSSLFAHNENVVFSVPSGPLHSLRDRKTWLHRNHHPLFEHRLVILPQFQSRLPTVIMAQHSEAVAISKGPVFE